MAENEAIVVVAETFDEDGEDRVRPFDILPSFLCSLTILVHSEQEIAAMKQRVEEMEAEAKKLREMQAAAEKSVDSSASVGSGDAMETEDDRQLADERSIYVGNVSLGCDIVCASTSLFMALCCPHIVQVDYSASPEDIQAHFQSCGTINRVTILCDKFTGHPKGYVSAPFA